MRLLTWASVTALIFLLLLTSASAQTPQSGKVAGDISCLLENHRAHYLRSDADAWAAMYAEDAVFTGFRGSYRKPLEAISRTLFARALVCDRFSAFLITCGRTGYCSPTRLLIN